jgi:hypothetical protein
MSRPVGSCPAPRQAVAVPLELAREPVALRASVRHPTPSLPRRRWRALRVRALPRPRLAAAPDLARSDHEWDERLAREVRRQAGIETAFIRLTRASGRRLRQALEWLEAADLLSGGLPPAYLALRSRWAREPARQGGPAAGAATSLPPRHLVGPRSRAAGRARALAAGDGQGTGASGQRDAWARNGSAMCR